MSICNVPAENAHTETGAEPDLDAAILDAARECVLAFGVRRTSLTEVARRAHVSRPTVYRRFPDRTALVASLMTREWASVFSAAEARGTAGPAIRQRTVARIVDVARSLRADPLLRKIVDVDPELLQPYIFDRLGTSQRMAIAHMAGWLRSGQQEGSVRPGDPEVLARVMLLAAQSNVLSGRLAMDRLTEAELDGELAVLLDRYLSPGPPR
jgi:AcrR family transcriptional regulator